jgi:hypothetical protein
VPIVDEERLLETFVADSCKLFIRHWLTLPRHGLVPHSRDFLDRAPVSHMPTVTIFEVTPDSLLCRFMGSTLVRHWQGDFTDQRLGDGLTLGPPAGVQAAQRMVEQPCGMRRAGAVTLTSGCIVKFEAVQLPLATDPGRAPRIVVYATLAASDREVNRIGRDDFAEVGDSTLVQWLDIGAGVPSSQPQAKLFRGLLSRRT